MIIINKWVGIGRLTKDPELKFTAGKGTAVTNITIAIADGFGENKTVDYIDIVIWGKSAEAVANYTKKGSQVAISGKIKKRSYEHNGAKRYVTEVVADMFGGVQFLDSKGSGNNNSNSNGNYQNSFNDFDDGMEEVNDGDIPF